MSEDIAFESHGNSEELVVVLHGLGGSRKAMEGVRKAIKAEKPNADIYCPNLEYGGPLGPFSRVPIEKIVDKLMTEMRQHWDKRQAPAASSGNSRRYTAITLVGHSLGGVLVRKIAILAYGETPGTPFEPAFAAFRQPSPLAPAIKRIIMLAGLSRGWTTSSAGNWLTTFLWGVLEIYGEMTAWITGTPYTVFAVRRGAPFLVQTRLQWLALVMRSMRPRGWNPAISPSGRTQLDNLCQGCCPDFESFSFSGRKTMPSLPRTCSITTLKWRIPITSSSRFRTQRTRKS
jgi:predicted esterase